jgi:serine protease AprX
MAERNDVAHIYANPQVKADIPDLTAGVDSPASPDAIEWNITKVKAPEVWAAGYTGQGAVIGGQDTGYQWDHPALKNQYRGWNGTVANHNYNWHDAIHSGGGVCGPNSQFPCDDYGHGTHTMGTMVGDDGGSNQIGMAPGARWIGCRNMDQGVGTPTTYSECYQWFIAPTDLNNQNPNPALAPDVINNSWGCPPSEGCTDPNVLLTVVENVRAAGILSAHSAGNSGSACSTISEPAAIYDASYTVGATDSSDNIAGFSSRGSVTVDGSNRLKPDISAPGVNIRSSVPGGGYEGGWNGTSMAGPHVAGLVALLISANPALAGQVDNLENAINMTAVPRTTAQTCGGVPGSQIPNNTYGYGRIDSWEAYNAIQHTFQINKTASSPEILPGEIITYTIDVTYLDTLSATTDVIISDTLPSGTTFISATPPGVMSGGVVRWNYVSMQPLENKRLKLVLQAQPTARGTIDNVDYAASSFDVPRVQGAPVSVAIADTDMMLSKTAPAAVLPGDIFTYTLTVTNPYATIPIHSVVLTDVVPSNAVFISATEPYTIQGNIVQWDFPSLAVAQASSVELAVQAPKNGDVINLEYAARADEANGVSGLPVQTTIFPHALELTKYAPASVQVGELFTYTLTVSNPNPIAATHNLILTDTLPASTEFITATQPVTISGDLITWERQELPPGETWSVDLVVRAPMIFAGEVVNQDYGVTSDEVGPIAGKPVTTLVHSLAIDKAALPELVDVGDLITYTLTVTNQNTFSATTNLVLQDALPENTAYVSSDGEFSAGTSVVTWTLPSLASGATWTAQLTVRVLPSAHGTIVNTDYSVRSAETPDPLFGAPVSTRLKSYIYLPLIYQAFSQE